ncbi:hypothetical protein [Sphingobacterium griseoflavum]|nr:hypothetical protein [Sphingobacterium griseoflavum]
MDTLGHIKIADSSAYKPVVSPIKYLNGEGTFVFEIDTSNKVTNILITEFKSYQKYNDRIDVKDYIVFVDSGSIGFTLEKVHTYQMNPSSLEVIDKLFERAKSLNDFQILKRRKGPNRKYLRIQFEDNT